MSRQRISVGTLSLSAVAFAGWMLAEGFSSTAYIPTQGDVPTVGYGSTRYEDGTPVTLADPPITRWRAEQLARNLHSEEEQRFRASIPGVSLYQEEYDLYLDFVGQFGIGNWRKSTMRRELLTGNHGKACNALPMWRRQNGRDCSLSANWGPKGCKGVWTRQLERYEKCLLAQ